MTYQQIPCNTIYALKFNAIQSNIKRYNTNHAIPYDKMQYHAITNTIYHLPYTICTICTIYTIYTMYIIIIESKHPLPKCGTFASGIATRMTHIPSTRIKNTIDLITISSLSRATIHRQNVGPSRQELPLV